MTGGLVAKTLTLAGVGLMLVLQVSLFRLSEGSDIRHHGAVTAELREVRRLDTELDELVLRSRFAMLSNYDPIVATVAQMVESLERLESGLAGDSESDLRNLEHFRDVREALQVKFRAIERFKSENALLGNLVHFFPTVVERAIEVVDPEEEHLVRGVTELVGSAIRLVSFSHRDEPADFEARLVALRQRADRGPAEERVRTVLAHAVRLAEQKQTTNGLIAEVHSRPVEDRLLELERSVQKGHVEADHVARRNRLLMLILAVCLMGAAVAVGARFVQTSRELREANVHLEDRIAERTHQLAERNADLEREVVVRQTAEEELLDRNRELDEFTYVASHDLQEPIRKLISFSSMLVEDVGDDLNERAREDIGFITDAAYRMQSLVQDLLALSRIGKQAMRREPVDLDACAEAALQALGLRLCETDAEIVRGELPTIQGDVTMLTQLFQNLIGNALKFTKEGQRPRIELSSSIDGDRVLVRIADDGIGIDPKYSETVFAPFKRLHGRSEYEGTGIGLSICAKTIHRHGGTIAVESAVGEGATFVLSFPHEPTGSPPADPALPGPRPDRTE